MFLWQIADSAVAQYVPPDFWGDEGKGQVVFRKNYGQRYKTNGQPATDVHYTTTGSPIVIDCARKSRVSFTMPVLHTDTTALDTLYRIDMIFHNSHEVDPIGLAPMNSVTHYYRGQGSYVNVPGYRRTLYEAVWDKVDVHFTQGIAGPRIAFVVRPGGNPSAIYLAFQGQDSLDIDWMGALKVFLGEKWFKFEQAMAYQVTSSNGIIPLMWTAGFEQVDGTAMVKFDFDSYDPEKPLVFLIGYPPLPQQGGGGPDNNLTWSTSVGGDLNGHGGDYIMGGDHLPDNDLIVTGSTGDPDFPASAGISFTPIVRDVFVSRFKYAPGDEQNDAKLLWTTFIQGGPEPGGVGSATGYETSTCIKYVPAHDRIYVGGWTNSTIWPMRPSQNPNDGSFYQATRKGSRDAFILRVMQNGIMDRSTLYGGNGDDIITTIAHDLNLDRVYCFGVTNSVTGSYNDCNSPEVGLPLCDPGTGDLQQNNNAGGLDMFVARFTADFHLTWGSFIGGSGDDRVFDSDQILLDNGTAEIALVGSTTNALPYAIEGAFQLNGSNPTPSGFIWLINSRASSRWGTHIHGTDVLQAVSFAKDRVRVMGATKYAANTTIEVTCAAVPGALSICDGEGDFDFVSNYLAEFNVLTKALKWSTLVGPHTDASAEIGADRYTQSIAVIHSMYRYMDIQTNNEKYFMVMGLAGQLNLGAFPTLPSFGMYHKAFNENMGNDQTEVFISLYDPNHELVWSTMFGSEFDHILSSPPDFADWDLMPRGSDFGHNLIWVDGQVLYLVGSTGGFQLHRECPYPFPGPSYCELTAGPLEDFIDEFDGMIARFDLRQVVVGTQDPGPRQSIALLLYPSPADDQLWVNTGGPTEPNSRLEIHDATGRLVLLEPYRANDPVAIGQLAAGVYSVGLIGGVSGDRLDGRFIHY